MAVGAFSAGLSGLSAHATALNVIGNNLANMNTVGFKSSAVAFQDLVSQSSGGSNGLTQLGLGVTTGAISHVFTQGSIENSRESTNVAIQGNGLFVVRNDVGTAYTRAGNFSFNDAGELVTPDGYQGAGLHAARSGDGRCDHHRRADRYRRAARRAAAAQGDDTVRDLVEPRRHRARRQRVHRVGGGLRLARRATRDDHHVYQDGCCSVELRHHGSWRRSESAASRRRPRPCGRRLGQLRRKREGRDDHANGALDRRRRGGARSDHRHSVHLARLGQRRRARPAHLGHRGHEQRGVADRLLVGIIDLVEEPERRPGGSCGQHQHRGGRFRSGDVRRRTDRGRRAARTSRTSRTRKVS